MKNEVIGKGTWLDKIGSVLIERERSLGRPLDHIAVESGIGASGIPHIGSLGDAVRAYGVSTSLRNMGYESKLIAYSDDMDGLRKIPTGLPDWLNKYLAKPVSAIPDPFGDCHESYGSHMGGLLLDALSELNVDYDFKSASQIYQSGILVDEIHNILSKNLLLGSKIAELVGQEKYKDSLPFFPICESCGRLYVAKAESYLEEERKVVYVCTGTRLGNMELSGCGYRGEVSVAHGKGKLAWKVEFAARWKALDIRFEAYGKDIMDSVRVNDWVSDTVLEYPHPLHAKYEMFLDKGGKKISKSAGNVFTPQTWLRYGTRQSLLLLLLKRISGTRHISVEDVPTLVDEYDTYEDVFFGKTKLDNNEKAVKIKGIYEYINHLKPPPSAQVHIPYRIISQQASLFSGPERIQKVYDRLVKYRLVSNETPELIRKIELAINWADDFLISDETFDIQLGQDEIIAIRELAKELESITGRAQTEDSQNELQNAIFSAAKRNNIQPRKFFKLMYKMLINSENGPKLGNYMFDLGIERTRIILIKYCK